MGVGLAEPLGRADLVLSVAHGMVDGDRAEAVDQPVAALPDRLHREGVVPEITRARLRVDEQAQRHAFFSTAIVGQPANDSFRTG
jgi:hypothetical protein